MEKNINDLLLEAHQIGVQNAIAVAAQTKTSLVCYENGKVVLKSVDEL